MDGLHPVTDELAQARRDLIALGMSHWAVSRAAQRSASEVVVLRARVAELEAAPAVDEATVASQLCERWRGTFMFHPAHTCDHGHGDVADFVEVPDALVFIPEVGEACVVISDRLPAEVCCQLAALLNYPRQVVARAAARAQITDGPGVVSQLIAERDAAHDLVRELENRVAELTARLESQAPG